MVENAKELAAVLKGAADIDGLEKPFRDKVETHLIELAVTEKIELVPHTEVTHLAEDFSAENIRTQRSVKALYES
jgi:hypothetical protein